MSVGNLITRVDAICKKYEKYDADKLNKDTNVSADDAFARLYAAVEVDVLATLQKSEAVLMESRRATVVAINAEIRRTKARLREDLPKLQMLAFKKVKGISKEELEARTDIVSALRDRIEAIPDGSTSAHQHPRTSAPITTAGVKIDSTSDGRFGSEYFQQTEESDKFRQDYEKRRMKQDEGLDFIAEGLGTLKNMAHDLNEELERQAPLVDEIDNKVDRAASDLKSTNVRLKDTITQLRSSRNFCCDVILLCFILGIAAYLYNVLK